MKDLKYFPKDKNDMYIIYELYSFDNLFKLLLKDGYEYEDALMFILVNCSLSAVVFQERIFNKKFLKLLAKDALNPKEAAIKAQLLYDVIT